MHIPSKLCIQWRHINSLTSAMWCHINSLTSAMSGVFSTWKLANSTDQGSTHPQSPSHATREPVGKHLLAHHCCVVKFKSILSPYPPRHLCSMMTQLLALPFGELCLHSASGRPYFSSAWLPPSLFSDLLTLNDPGISILDHFSSLPYLHSFFGDLVQFLNSNCMLRTSKCYYY